MTTFPASPTQIDASFANSAYAEFGERSESLPAEAHLAPVCRNRDEARAAEGDMISSRDDAYRFGYVDFLALGLLVLLVAIAPLIG